MSKMALKQDGVAVNVVPVEVLPASFHPDIAAMFAIVPDEVEQGWREREDGTWEPPQLPTAPDLRPLPASAYVIDIPTFKMRFTPQQLAAIRASEDPVVKGFLTEVLDDPRTLNVNLALPFVQGAVAYLAQAQLIQADEIVGILAPKG